MSSKINQMGVALLISLLLTLPYLGLILGAISKGGPPAIVGLVLLFILIFTIKGLYDTICFLDEALEKERNLDESD